MPKANSTRIAEAQRQRQHISKKAEKYEKYGPSTVYLQVLGSGARGVPNTLYLFTDQKRYLFNCGECTQRLAHEHKVKLSKLDHIFITSKTWRNIGGLPGLSLTLQDVGVPKITLHGPDGLDELYNATRRFVIMKDMQVTMAKCSPSEDFEDNVMSVKYVILGPTVNLFDKDSQAKPAAKKPRLSEFEEFTHDDTDYYSGRPLDSRSKHAEKSPRAKSAVLDPHKKKTEKALMDLNMKGNCSVSYICTLKKRLGTLDLAKCVELGVKPGPQLGQLKSGHDVVLPDGRLVLSKDVKTPDDPGPVFIVLDVADISYLKEADFAAHFDNGVNPPENIPSLIVHMSPPQVFHHPTYKSFMSMFGPSTRHLVLNSQNLCLGSEAVHRTQHKLHLLDPDIFPLLRDVSVPAEWNAHPPLPRTDSPVKLKGFEDLKNRIAIAQFQNIINMESQVGDSAALTDTLSTGKLDVYSARTLTMFHLRPKKQLDRSAEPKLHVQDYYQETMDVDGFVGSLQQFRHLVDGVRYAKSNSINEYPKITFLGTGSCIPSKTRNTSGIIVHIDEKSSILLDCGEGTFGQMVRFYGPRKVNEVLRTLKAIYISHLHADHHIGLIGVLQARFEAFLASAEISSPVYLLAPGQIVTWLTVYDQHFERITNEFTLIPNQTLMGEGPNEMSSANLASIGIDSVRTCLVPHCPNAFGVALGVAGHKITYSGDTLPTEKLVQIGENSTVLIHEATMEDELADEARKKMHSTTSQAIDIGRQMNAQYTVLTHFSQRYARLPRLNPHILHDNNTVGIAFDNMQITMNDLELLPHMYAPLQLMFAEHCVEMELKAAHRERRRERAASPTLVPAFFSNGPELKTNKKIRFNTKYDIVVSGSSVTIVVSEPAGQPPSQPEARAREAPAARGAGSAPARAQAQYRESHASRLRQQLKGMSTTSALGPPPRSKSSSPTKLSRRSISSDHSSRSRPASPEKALDLIQSPRPLSDTSSMRSITKDTQDILRGVTNPPSCCTFDSAQSKTISKPHAPSSTASGHSASSAADSRHSSGSRRRSTFKILPSNGDQSKTPNTSRGSPKASGNRAVSIDDCNSSAGARKKSNATIIKAECDQSKLPTKPNIVSSSTNSKPSSVRIEDVRSTGRIKSGCIITAASCKLVSRDHTPETGYGKPLVTPVNKKLTIRRDILQLSQAVNSTVTANEKSVRNTPVCQRKKSPIRSWRAANSVEPVARPASLYEKNYDNKTNTSSKCAGKKLRASLTNPNVKADHPGARNPGVASVLRPMSSLHRRNNSPSKSFGESVSTLSSRSIFPYRKSVSGNCGNQNVSRVPPNANNSARDSITKPQLYKDDHAFKPYNRDIKQMIGRPSANSHGSKTFKPQLEDIKSSFLLLNKITKARLDGYERIEGLNWISWK